MLRRKPKPIVIPPHYLLQASHSILPFESKPKLKAHNSSPFKPKEFPAAGGVTNPSAAWGFIPHARIPWKGEAVPSEVEGRRKACPEPSRGRETPSGFPPPSLKISKTALLSLIGLSLFFLLLRWNSFTAPFDRGEGGYSYSAWLLRQGLAPYVHTYDHKPPMIIYTYLLGQLLSDTALWPPRLLAAIFAAGVTLLTALIAQKEFGRPAGWITAWLLTPMLFYPPLTTYAANTEIFMLLPLLVFLFLYTRKKAQASPKIWFWAGVTSSLALLYKPICLFVISFVFLVWAIGTWRLKPNLTQLLKRISFAFVGACLTTFLVLAYFIIKGHTRFLWEEIIIFNRYYSTQPGWGLSSLWFQINKFFHYWWPLFTLLIIFLIKLRRPHIPYIGIFLAALLGIFPSPLSHYYLLLAPFWALVATSAIQILAQKIKIFYLPLHTKTALLTGPILILLTFPLLPQFSLTPTQLATWVYHGNPFAEAPLVSSEIEKITSPQDYIFVAGSEPEILYYAKRRTPTRFHLMYPLGCNSPLSLHYQQELIDALNSHPPKVIVLVPTPLSWMWADDTPEPFINYLNRTLNENYQLVGITLYDQNQPRWLTSPEIDQARQATLLVFVKK